MKIDAHAHILPKRFYEAAAKLPGTRVISLGGNFKLIERAGVRLVGYDEDWFPSEHSLRDMDAKGIDMRLISITPVLPQFDDIGQQIELAKIVNDETIELCQKRPDRLRALPSLPLGDVEASLAELNRVASAKEVCGLAMGSNAAGVPLSDPRFEALWKRINELKIPVVEHPTQPSFASAMPEFHQSTILGFMFDTELMVARLIQYGIFERYQDFPFVVAHTGAGLMSLIARMDGASRHPEIAKNMSQPFSWYMRRFYYDTCIFFAPAILMARDYVGNDRLMFGTDYPYIDQSTKYIDSLPIPEADKAAINGGNAQRVFKI
jgi:aminocarboxymuconate-semialdehyde decarboxylase